MRFAAACRHLCSPAPHERSAGLLRAVRVFQGAEAGLPHESYRRARRIVEVAGPRASRGRAAQHHSDPRQRADQGRQGQAQPEGHRPRPGSDRLDRRRGLARRRDHRAGAHVLRDRAQAARGRADRDRRLRRPRRALDPRRALALHAADAAGERFPRSRRRRHDAFVHARRRRPEAADRQDAVRDLDRRDALLPERHLSARRRHGEDTDAARGGDRRPPPGAGRAAAADGRRRHARHHRAAQDRGRGAAADRDRRRRGCDRAFRRQDPLHHRRRRAHLEADRRHLPRLCARHPGSTTTRT